LNRISEEKVLSAEAISKLLWFSKKENYPEKEIETIWEEILFNHFHDVLAGTAIPEAHIDNDRRLGKAIASSEKIINEMLWHFSKHINTDGE